MKVEIARGWGLRVGGSSPYLAWEIHPIKESVQLREKYHRAVKVVLIPLAEYRRLKALKYD